MENKNMRSAFSMLMAIFVMVVMALIGAFVMSLSGKIVQTTTAQYQHEQAVLYSKSYTEYAILAITGVDRNVRCVSKITGTIGQYDIDVHIAYIGIDSALGQCTGKKINPGTAVTTTSTPVNALIDVYVRYKDPENPTAPAFTVHRRTIQKI